MPLPCFVYGVSLDPSRLEACAPDASFDRVAHLPTHRLAFSPGGAPVVVEDDGHTVWGAVFEVGPGRVDAIAREEGMETGRSIEATAVDRDGGRISVVAVTGPDGGHPSESVVDHMLAGARHWDLPAGWIMGLEDLVDPFEL